MPNTESISARRVLAELKKLNITHMVGLPDSATAALFALLGEDDSIRLVTVTREGEAFALAAGLWIGGSEPVVLIQNTGLLEAGDALRGTLQRMRIPVLCLISFRGYRTLQNRVGDALDQLSRPDLDSAALLLEPTLKAWELPYAFLTSDEDLPTLRAQLSLARSRLAPTAVVLRGSLQ